MGGGDLNLKKSWHPSTLRNIERVWKAEQKHEVEKQKIEQLQKELAEERAREEIQAYAEEKGVVRKKEERLDWMYQGPAAMVNREDYLLGRKIDKTLELLQQQETGVEPKKDDSSEVARTMFSSQDLTGTATVDLANKIREDPLFSIMKKEKEQRKNLLTNPVKMKQLQQLLQASITKKSKKHKKDKKRKHALDDLDNKKSAEKKKLKVSLNSDAESEEDKVSSRDRNSHFCNKRPYEDESYSSSKAYKTQSKNHDPKHKKSHVKWDCNYDDRHQNISNHSSLSKKDYYGDSPQRNKRHQSSYDRDDEDSNRKNRKHHFSHNRENDSSHNHSRNSYSQPHNKEGNLQKDRPKFNDNNKNSGKDDSKSKRKIDLLERERLLKEMQDNAKWREEQRKRNVRKYMEDDEKEDKNYKVDTSDFLKPMLAKAAGKGSLENRVKQKIFSIQRSSADMDKHFAKR